VGVKDRWFLPGDGLITTQERRTQVSGDRREAAKELGVILGRT